MERNTSEKQEDEKTHECEESRKTENTKRRRITKGIAEEEKVLVVHKMYVYTVIRQRKKKQTNKERKREEII